METELAKEVRKHTADSAIVMCCTLLSRLLGIVKARAIATVFGASHIADVINFTFNIPNNFRKLIAEGALSSAYIPVFTASLAEEPRSLEKSSALLARMQAFQMLILIPLIVLTWIWKGEIVGFLSDFSEPEHLRLSSELLVYFMVFLATITAASLYGGVLHSHGAFFIASAAPLSFSLAVIVSVFLLSERFGAYSMAIGVVSGGFLQAIITWARLHHLGYRMRFSFDFSYDPFKRVMRSWTPVILTASLAIISQQIAFYFATSLSAGSVTAFSNAIIIWQAPYGIAYSAIATVFFPAMVRAFHIHNYKQLGAIIERGLVYLATFLFPAAILFSTLRHEITAVLLQSGQFLLSDTMETGRVLLWFALGMPFVAWYGFLQRACFSLNRFSSAVIAALVVASIDVVAIMVGIRLGWETAALSVANTLSFAGGAVLLWIVVHHYTEKQIVYGSVLRSLGKLVLANTPLAIAAILYYRYEQSLWWESGSTLSNAGILAVLCLIALAITIISYRLLHIEFLSVLLHKKPEHKIEI
jgi:putative peptidoglycan lipid II flippase